MMVKDDKNITSHPFLSGGGAFDQLPSDTGEKRSPEGENGRKEIWSRSCVPVHPQVWGRLNAYKANVN